MPQRGLRHPHPPFYLEGKLWMPDGLSPAGQILASPDADVVDAQHSTRMMRCHQVVPRA
jgi:hypothetical protein